mmetsp:Transcript_26521/g.71716  ORF Transcript_26521/g.71716 Transcript_26521/m.71716 type:complete len:277 (-) Transcript_26521:801-1631(-)
MPTLRARSTAQGPMSRNLPNSTSARKRCTWLSKTCSTMGSCSGGFLSCAPCASHRSKAVSCSLKNEEGLNSAVGLAMRVGSCIRHISAAMSQACHIGWLCVGGRRGYDTGLQLAAVIMRSASRKLRKREATSKSDLNSFWNSGLGSTFQAMVSVMAVKIQFSSPSGVLRSVCRPGIWSMRSLVMPSWRSSEREQNHRRATLMGVVRQAVNTSAGSSGFCGSTSCAPQAASTMISRMGSLGSKPPGIPANAWPWCALESMKALKALMITPADEQSRT